MEETSTTTTTKKKPLSLNQRYNHLLSASHSRPQPLPREEDNRSKLKVKDDDAPHFSFSDIDSSPDVTHLSNEKEFDTRDNSVDDELIDDDFSQSSIAEIDPPIEKPKMEKVKIEGRRRLCKVSSEVSDDDDDDNDDYQEEITAQDSSVPIGNLKPEKVKIEGRRRLCKVSSGSKDSDDDDGGDHQKEESHEFFDVSDYSVPPPGKDEGCGGNDIRNILDDLSSRLDFLSIEKKRNPKPVDLKAVPMGEDLLQEGKQKGVAQKDELEDSEFGSVSSSLAALSDLSSSSSGVNGGVVEKGVEGETLSESDGEKFYEETNMNAYKGKSKDVSRNIKEEPGVSKKKSTYDIGNSKDVSRKIEESAVSQKKATYNKGKSKDISRKIKEEPVVSKKKSIYDFNYGSDEDQDENDCVEVGRSNFTKKAGRHGTSLDKGNDDSGVVEVLGDDDDANEVVSKNDFGITFSDPRSTYKLPPKIGKMLYPHQREGLKWLWSLHCKGKGGILGDDMGLGKTMQISGFLAGLFSSRLIKRAMIVAPKTLMPHWIKELTAVGLSDKIKEYYGTCPKLRQYELQYVFQNRGILLTTYDIVRFNEKQLHGNGYYDDDGDDDPLWDYMVLDEGHLIKNPSTQRAKSLLGIPCSHRIIISGTPIQNNLKELWALFNFCCPDLLGDHKEFKERYEHPILRGNDKKASERDKRVGSMVAKELRERIQPYFLRRLKSEVFNEDDSEKSKLSKKNEIIVWLRLTSCQRQLYEAFLKSEIVLSAFDGSPLAAITILKKICDHPYLLTKRAAEDVLEGMDSMLNQDDCGLAEKLAMHAAQLTKEDDFQEKHDNLSCKISFILSLLNKLIPEGHNVLIFSQTRKMLNLIQESLLANGFDFLRIDGTTKATDRLKIVDKFQEGRGPPIFLLTSQVGGLGLTLTNADRVIVVDPAWNPSTDNQSVDRAYRIGQKKDVIVYRLMTCGTIEEKIYRMQIYKGGLFKTATEHKEQTRYFSQQDLKELFSLPKDGFDVSPTQLQLVAEHGDQITMSDDLKAHIKFLESLDIGGVSDHSLLYSKTEPTQAVDIKEEEIRRNATKIYRNYGSSSKERYVDGSQFAFNPKDVNRHNIISSPQHSAKMTESDIKERMNRLSQILSNKATVARLPDSGEKIRKQLTELTSELEKLTTPEKSNEVIDLDDLSDTLHRSLNV